MKSGVTDDCDDIFGPPRIYCPPKNRPSMISAKYRQKEERRKVLKISMNKLKKIDDPESSLCRSVLINNTMKRLQKETKEEKLQKQHSFGNTSKTDDYTDFDAKLAEEIVLKELEESDGVRFPSRKRSFEEIEDVLKQFYIPPTPRMLTAIDEDEIESKRSKKEEFSVSEFINNNIPRFVSQSEADSSNGAFSCGHASLFSELQSNVYHNLIASLET